MQHGPEFVVVLIAILALALGAATRGFSQRTGFPYTIAILLLGLVTGIAIKHSHGEGGLAGLLHLLSALLCQPLLLPVEALDYAPFRTRARCQSERAHRCARGFLTDFQGARSRPDVAPAGPVTPGAGTGPRASRRNSE